MACWAEGWSGWSDGDCVEIDCCAPPTVNWIENAANVYTVEITADLLVLHRSPPISGIGDFSGGVVASWPLFWPGVLGEHEENTAVSTGAPPGSPNDEAFDRWPFEFWDEGVRIIPPEIPQGSTARASWHEAFTHPHDRDDGETAIHAIGAYEPQGEAEGLDADPWLFVTMSDVTARPTHIYRVNTRTGAAYQHLLTDFAEDIDQPDDSVYSAPGPALAFTANGVRGIGRIDIVAKTIKRSSYTVEMEADSWIASTNASWSTDSFVDQWARAAYCRRDARYYVELMEDSETGGRSVRVMGPQGGDTVELARVFDDLGADLIPTGLDVVGCRYAVLLGENWSEGPLGDIPALSVYWDSCGDGVLRYADAPASAIHLATDGGIVLVGPNLAQKVGGTGGSWSKQDGDQDYHRRCHTHSDGRWIYAGGFGQATSQSLTTADNLGGGGNGGLLQSDICNQWLFSLDGATEVSMSQWGSDWSDGFFHESVEHWFAGQRADHLKSADDDRVYWFSVIGDTIGQISDPYAVNLGAPLVLGGMGSASY